MQKSFISGIDLSYILAYLKDELALEAIDAGEYRYKSMCITVAALPSEKLGSISMQRNQIDMRGTEKDILEFEHAFLMRFLSAGG